MSETHISALPDIPLLTIFRHLSLNDLINSIGLVCVGWRALLPRELFHRRSLVLVRDCNNHETLSSAPECCLQQDFPMLANIKSDDGSPVVQIQKPNMDKLKNDFVEIESVEHSTLAALLPQITHLTVMFKYVSSETTEKVFDLLHSNWNQTLISLSIELYFFSINCYEDVMVLLFRAINQLRSLQHLRLLITATSRGGFVLFPTKLKIVPRLKTLCVQMNRHDPSWFFRSLQLVPHNTDTLPKICFHNHNVNINDFVKLASSPAHQLVQHFTHLTAYAVGAAGMVRTICAEYSSLTTLSLKIEAFQLIRLSRDLCRLQHLVALKLTLCENYELYDDDDDNMEYLNRPINAAELNQGWPILMENPPPLEEDQQVHTVRLLHLDLKTVSHENMAALRIPEVFPNVQVISLIERSLKCHTCQYEHFISLPARLFGGKVNLHSEWKDDIDKCTRLARQALKSCAHLREIHYCPDPLTSGQAEYISITPQQL